MFKLVCKFGSVGNSKEVLLIFVLGLFIDDLLSMSEYWLLSLSESIDV